MQTVKIIKQWRGHDPGATPELTDERAAELIANGYAIAIELKPVEPTKQVEVPKKQPEKQAKKKALFPNVVPTPNASIDDGSDGRTVDTDGDEASVADDA